MGGTVKVSILGTDERDYYVAMDYEIAGTKAFKTEYQNFEPNNEEGYQDGDIVQEGVMGYIVKTYRMKYDDHTRELLSRDYVTTTEYSSLPKIIARVAPEETTEATEATTEPTKETEAPTTAPTTKPTEPSTEATTAATEPVSQETTAATEETRSTTVETTVSQATESTEGTPETP